MTASRLQREQKQRRVELVAALRSGDYEQVHAALRVGDKFCCLGVACDKSGLGRWEGGGLYKVFGDCSNAIMPYGVREYYGFRTGGGDFTVVEGMPHLDKILAKGPVSGLEISLYSLNDYYGFTFAEIADVIEFEPKGLVAR